MNVLIITACLLDNELVCIRQQYIEPMSLTECLAQRPRAVAEWQMTHPDYRVAMIRCERWEGDQS